MEYIIIAVITGAVIGLCLFFFPLWCYRRGLKDGLALNQGKPIQPIQNPVQAVTSYVDKRHETKEAKEQQDAFTKGLSNILSYDGSSQEGVEK